MEAMMGGELWMAFGKGERPKVKKWLEKVSRPSQEKDIYLITFTVDGSDNEVWAEFRPNRFEIGYRFGGWGSTFTTALASCLGAKFQINRVGWDSVGWCKTPYDRQTLQPFGLEIDTCLQQLKELDSLPKAKSVLQIAMEAKLGIDLSPRRPEVEHNLAYYHQMSERFLLAAQQIVNEQPSINITTKGAL